MRIGIIGAGPAGMTAAYELLKAGAEVDLYESGAQVGGMARSLALWGQTVDLGPHRFFSRDTRVNRLWLEVAGNDYDMVGRLTRILYKGTFFHYPLRPFNALVNLGLVEASRCLASYGRARFGRAPSGADASFEEWVVGRFGRRLFEIFFKTYSEKLWGIPCSELDADFAAQRIRNFSLGEAVKTAFGADASRHKTLVDQFAYPHGGNGSIYQRMANRCRAMGGRIHLQTEVARVAAVAGRATGLVLADGTCHPFDHIVSSMPLTALVRGLADVPADVAAAAARLRYRNTILVYLRVQGDNLFRDNWLYVHSPGLATGRITNFRNWTPHICGGQPDTILALEYWCNREDAIWQASDEYLLELAGRDIRAAGLLGGRALLEGRVLRLDKSYPVYARGFKAPLGVVAGHLRQIGNLTVIGRYGAFKYNNQDHSILMGLLAAQNIMAGAQHDLWTINTDYEYQESSTITRTGLVEHREGDGA
jgi:protoporphyrinogen oxidase